MAALDTILQKISEVQAGAETEKAQVAQALAEINATIADLKAKLDEAINNQVDVDIVNAALDGVKKSIESIYEPLPPQS